MIGLCRSGALVRTGTASSLPTATWSDVWGCGENPAVLPSDLEIWEAMEWPREQWAVPNNCNGLLRPWPRHPGLAGGHSDGDEAFATLNHDIVEFLEHTEAAVRPLDLATAAIRALGLRRDCYRARCRALGFRV